MLPQLSSLSVSIGPGDRLRYWCSSRYLRIPPLHLEFHRPLPYSRIAVLKADHGLSPCIKLLTYNPAYALFTPSDSEQRLHPTYYRGCWHVVSRCLLEWYHQFPVTRAFFPIQQKFTTRRQSSFTRRCCVRLPSIAQNSLLLPPVGVWAVSQSQCGRTPSQAGYPSKPW